jgi:hypothetical protein
LGSSVDGWRCCNGAEEWMKWGSQGTIPSGKHTKNYGKSPFLMGKSTINGHFQ